MSRPHRVRPNKRDFIVEEASRLFYEHGTGVGVDTLTRELGIAKMTLYKHFPTKDELIVACLRHIDDRYRDRLRACTEGDYAPEERILSIFDSLRDWFTTPSFRGCAFINATVELADPDHPAHDAVVEHKQRTREWVAGLVAECGITEVEFIARQIVQLMEGAITTALVENDASAADVARATAAMVLTAGKEK
ncbi:TetR/AcrR family transcriptional regulator [Streptomyces viridiviolaceus]